MTDIYMTSSTTNPQLRCGTCGGTTRIYGIEPHARLAHTDVHTYVCEVCDESQVIVVPLPKPAA